MNEITLKYHLLIASLLSIVIILVLFYFRNKINKKSFFFLILFFSIYLLIVSNAFITDIYYKYKLSLFDLDKDGSFSTDEQLKGFREAEYKVTSDLGRNLSFITGAIFSLLVSPFIFGIVSLYKFWFKKKS